MNAIVCNLQENTAYHFKISAVSVKLWDISLSVNDHEMIMLSNLKSYKTWRMRKEDTDNVQQ